MRLVPLVAAVLVLSGCATPLQPRSGFLSDYERLRPSKFENVLIFKAPGFDPAAYARIESSPTRFVGDSAEMRALDAEFRAEILKHIDAELALRVKSPPAAAGATKLLKLRSAITDIETPNRYLNAATALLLGSLTRGGAALEIELADAATGEVLLAATCSEKGHWFADQLSSFSMLGHARIAATECLKRFEIAYSERP